MMGFSIFTHKKASFKQNSSYLHRYEVTGDERMALIAQEELRKQGHEIYECLENRTRSSSSRRQTSSAASGSGVGATGSSSRKPRR